MEPKALSIPGPGDRDSLQRAKLPLALASPSFLQPLIFGELVSQTYAQVHFYSELFDGFHMT